MDSAADKKIKSRAKLPSWLIEEEPKVQEEVVLSHKMTEAVPTVTDSVTDNEDALLGAPKASYAAESDEFCTPSSPLEALSEAEVPPGFVSSAEHEVKASPESAKNISDSKANVEVVEEATTQENKEEADDDPKVARIKADMAELEKVVNSLEFLSYLKPRLNRIRKNGCEIGDLVGLYRMASQVMLENMQRQTEIMQRNKTEYERQMRKLQEEVLFEQSSALVSGKAPTKKSYASQRLAAAAEAAGMCVSAATGQSAPISASEQPTPTAEAKAEEKAPDNNAIAALRRQMEYKDNLLLKARMEAEDAEKRCEKMAQDVTNIKARLEKDLKLKSQKAKESLFNRLLPVLDSFDGALKSSSNTQDSASLLAGLKQIHSQLLDCCQAEGLEAVEAEGRPFDPNFHEAMGHVKTNAVPEDCIYDELRRGYMLDGKLLRASMVRLASPDPDAPQIAQVETKPTEDSAAPAEDGTEPPQAE